VKRFAIAALLAAFACIPSVGWADTIAARSAPAGQSIARPPAATAPVETSAGEAADYAAREAATPALGAFEGGRDGIYIGAGALVVVLLIVIILILI